MIYFLIKLYIIYFIDNIFINFQLFKNFHPLNIRKTSDNNHIANQNIIYITVVSQSDSPKYITYINESYSDQIKMYINETLQNEFTSSVLINPGKTLIIKLHYPINFNGSCRAMFKSAENIIEIKFKKFSGCTSIFDMFHSLSSIQSIDLSSFDGSNVTLNHCRVGGGSSDGINPFKYVPRP